MQPLETSRGLLWLITVYTMLVHKCLLKIGVQQFLGNVGKLPLEVIVGELLGVVRQLSELIVGRPTGRIHQLLPVVGR